jgi:WD40 repeat protein
MITETKLLNFLLIDFMHLNLDTTITTMRLDELQTRLWFCAGLGTWMTVGRDFVTRIWKISNGEAIELPPFHAHGDVITDLKYASKIEMLITSSMDGTLRMWSTSNFKLKHSEVVKKVITKKSKKQQEQVGKKEEKTEGLRGFVISNTSDNLLLCWGFFNEVRIYEASGLVGFEKMGKLEGHLGVDYLSQDRNKLYSYQLTHFRNLKRRQEHNQSLGHPREDLHSDNNHRLSFRHLHLNNRLAIQG